MDRVIVSLNKVLLEIELKIASADWESSDSASVPANSVATMSVLEGPKPDKPKAKFRSSLELAEEDAGVLTCKVAMRALFLNLARSEPQQQELRISKLSFLSLCERFRIVPVLLNPQEASQAFTTTTGGESTDLKGFWDTLAVCALAFARPPHNIKPADDGSTLRLQYSLWRFMGLHDSAYKTKMI